MPLQLDRSSADTVPQVVDCSRNSFLHCWEITSFNRYYDVVKLCMYMELLNKKGPELVYDIFTEAQIQRNRRIENMELNGKDIKIEHVNLYTCLYILLTSILFQVLTIYS